MTSSREPVMPLLMVRRAVVADEHDVAALLREVPLDFAEVADLIRHHRVLVLSDLMLAPGAPPVAAAAFRIHRAARTAQLAGIGVAVHLRRNDLPRRLLISALTLLRAEGFEPWFR